ncbi:TetR family transcriptional regulator [Nocardioides convexus]|uniref:TetR family transcriptional regulator n=1 Tax=Nocardioides convexus TaxID=2712224 RepID=UPI0024187A59|nr:TetR family transcriptional regulator [Nocardioides convexus]
MDIPLFARTTTEPDSRLGAALVLLRFLVALPIGALVGGWLLRHVNAGVLTAVGMAAAGASFLAMAQWDKTSLDGFAANLPLVLGGLGFGLALAPVNAAILASTDDEAHGLASALVVVARMVGMLVGISALTTIGLRRLYAAQADDPSLDLREPGHRPGARGLRRRGHGGLRRRLAGPLPPRPGADPRRGYRGGAARRRLSFQTLLDNSVWITVGAWRGPVPTPPSLGEQIMACALATVAERGIAALALRDVAERAGTSTAAVYSLFGSKEALHRAVLISALTAFADAQASDPPTDDPVADIAGLGLRYVGWATEHPRLYEAMFTDAAAGLTRSPSSTPRGCGRSSGSPTPYDARSTPVASARRTPTPSSPRCGRRSTACPSSPSPARLSEEVDVMTAAWAVIAGWLAPDSPN